LPPQTVNPPSNSVLNIAVAPGADVPGARRRNRRRGGRVKKEDQDDKNSKRSRAEPPTGNSALYKTELCRSFSETGFCRYGNKCQFAHGIEDLRPVVRHRKYKTEKCKNFSKNGVCPYGRRCRFVHSEDMVTLNSIRNDNKRLHSIIKQQSASGQIQVRNGVITATVDNSGASNRNAPHNGPTSADPSGNPAPQPQHTPPHMHQPPMKSNAQSSPFMAGGMFVPGVMHGAPAGFIPHPHSVQMTPPPMLNPHTAEFTPSSATVAPSESTETLPVVSPLPQRLAGQANPGFSAQSPPSSPSLVEQFEAMASQQESGTVSNEVVNSSPVAVIVSSPSIASASDPTVSSSSVTSSPVVGAQRSPIIQPSRSPITGPMRHRSSSIVSNASNQGLPIDIETLKSVVIPKSDIVHSSPPLRRSPTQSRRLSIFNLEEGDGHAADPSITRSHVRHQSMSVPVLPRHLTDQQRAMIDELQPQASPELSPKKVLAPIGSPTHSPAAGLELLASPLSIAESEDPTKRMSPIEHLRQLNVDSVALVDSPKVDDKKSPTRAQDETYFQKVMAVDRNLRNLAVN